ncbi:hypothetical protein ACQP2P_16590 [Dactylosporangium sp. CA-139114]|uniref:hypothetical protein n=1 Tax=Dactylosporangium sp. CA-139114 TaxID=3239931 RepID=UPI003D96907C
MTTTALRLVGQSAGGAQLAGGAALVICMTPQLHSFHSFHSFYFMGRLRHNEQHSGRAAGWRVRSGSLRK